MKVAVIPCEGIGDGLIMMVASYHLKQAGHEVTTFHERLGELAPWFPGQTFIKRSLLSSLDDYDSIIFQNANTSDAFDLINRYRSNIHVVYASYDMRKHLPLTDQDIILDRSQPIARGIAQAITLMFGKKEGIVENGLIIPKHLAKPKNPKEIAIHPTSTSFNRMWSAHKFIQVAKHLKKRGYHPTFCVSPSERDHWKNLLKGHFAINESQTLSELASYLCSAYLLIGNESGLGHLASNLGIPTLIIARSAKEMALWQPGFFPGKVITPSNYIPNFKGIRLRDKKWQAWISIRSVLNVFLMMSVYQ